MNRPHLALLVSLPLTLAACGGDSADDATASGGPSTGADPTSASSSSSTSTAASTTNPAPTTTSPATTGDVTADITTAVDATTVDASTLDATTLDATTVEPATGDATGTTQGVGDTGDTGTDDTGEPPPPVDACADVAPVCPAGPPAKAGGGLVAIDRCGFPLVDQDTWTTQADRVAALAAVLPTITIGALADAEFNRDGVALKTVPGGVKNVAQAFRWDDEDNDKEWWIPQGLTGSADATPDGTVGGRKLLLVSWYHDEEKDPNNTVTKGVRVSLVDIDDPAKPRYRHILLVEPTAGDPVDFKPIPIHAGGLTWFGDYLYVVDTGKGFRVFDMRALMRVETALESVGWDPATKKYYAGLYKYVLPQVGSYKHGSKCAPIFSSVALDRTSEPPTLVSSEYCSADACGGALKGRIYRWPLDPASGRLAAATVWPLAAHYMAQTHVQGGLVHMGDVYLSSSAPAGSAGALYVLPGGGASKTATWVDTPEDLLRDGKRLWSLSEGTGIRVVFAVDLADLPG